MFVEPDVPEKEDSELFLSGSGTERDGIVRSDGNTGSDG